MMSTSRPSCYGYASSARKGGYRFSPPSPCRTVTETILPDSSFPFRLVSMAVRANGNADSLIMGMMKIGREQGHGSVCLMSLGVPTSGEPATEQQGTELERGNL